MTDKPFEIKNRLARSNSEKFYLDQKTADVKFVFGTGTDQIEHVPAHRIILSVGSSVFETMFYGSLPEEGDIKIDGASAAVFKEFLQFFYLNKVRLTPEHIADVTNMCKMYEMVEALNLCEAALQASFTIDDMCSGYALANLLELTHTIRYCEIKIVQHAETILKSTNFLECNRDTLDKIIQLVTSKCTVPMIVDAYMAWAKAECGRKNLEETATNLKTQLGQSFDRIPFAEMSMEKFSQFITTYNDLLDEPEKNGIISKIIVREYKEALDEFGLDNDNHNHGFEVDASEYDLYDPGNNLEDDALDYVDDFDDQDAFDYVDNDMW